MRFSLSRPFLTAFAVFGLFLMSPVADVFASVCCHCYFRRQAEGQQTQCITISDRDSCDPDVISSLQNPVGGNPEITRLQSTRADLVFECDRNPVSSTLCRAGTGNPTDRCPSRPPVPLTSAGLLSAYPTAPGGAGATGGTNTNATNNTNETTNTTNASGNTTRHSSQERARDYNRSFPNPLPGLTIQKTIGSIVRMLVGIVGILFVLVFIWGSFLYMTAAGDPKQTQKGKDAIKNAVIGIGIVMIAYTAVSLVISTAGNLMGTTTTPTVSQEEGDAPTNTNPTNTSSGGITPSATDAQALCSCTCGDSNMLMEPVTDGLCTPATCLNTCNRVCASHGAVRESACSGSGSLGGSSPDVCANFYGGPIENCFRTGGACPSGVNSLDDFFIAWGSRLPGGNVPASQAACRSCITTNITNLATRYPGLDTTCMPAVATVWNRECSSACIGSGSYGTGDLMNICSSSAYNNDESCRTCLAHAVEVTTRTPTSEEARRITSGGCPTPGGNAIVWCATGHPGWDAPGSVCSFR